MSLRNGTPCRTWRQLSIIRWPGPAVLCCLLTCGCGGREYKVVPVSGRVTLDGLALTELHVDFQPLTIVGGDRNPGPSSYGKTDAEGRFTLQMVRTNEPGAVAGKHVVRLTLASSQSDGALQESDVAETLLPDECRDGTLKFDVPPEGTDQADFVLTSPELLGGTE